MIIADTGAIIALIDQADPLHEAVVRLYDDHAAEWVLPWAILPEVDYLLGAHVSEAAQTAFQEDLAAGAYIVEWGRAEDLGAAVAIIKNYEDLRLGLVDALVMLLAGRHRARAIVTFDERHFRAVPIPGDPPIWPADTGGQRLRAVRSSARKQR